MTGPRVAIVLPDLRGGGVERVRLSLAEQFLAEGFEVDFVLWHSGGELLADVPARCRVFALGAQRLRDGIVPAVRYLRRERPDAILAAIWPLSVATVVARALSRHRPRLVVSDHNQLSRQYGGKSRGHRLFLSGSMAAAYRLADARVAVSAGVADDLAELSGMGRDRFTVIHNPLPIRAGVAPASVAAAQAAWGEGGGRRILSVGSLKPQKNHALAIRALARQGDRMARLLILGEGHCRGALEALARSEGVADRVFLPGFAADPMPFFHAADLFVLASDYEGFGNVIVEALSCGLPVVATDCPSGPSEILDDGRFGDLVPVGDAEAMARAMTAALGREPDRELLFRRAASFSPENAARAYLSLLFPERTSSSTATESLPT